MVPVMVPGLRSLARTVPPRLKSPASPRGRDRASSPQLVACPPGPGFYGPMSRPQKINFGEMCEMGIRDVLIYCADYRCSHSIEMSGGQWPDHVRLSDANRFVCKACGKRGADVRPDFNWDRNPGPPKQTAPAFEPEAGAALALCRSGKPGSPTRPLNITQEKSFQAAPAPERFGPREAIKLGQKETAPAGGAGAVNLWAGFAPGVVFGALSRGSRSILLRPVCSRLRAIVAQAGDLSGPAMRIGCAV
jgi:hypothetical protein